MVRKIDAQEGMYLSVHDCVVKVGLFLLWASVILDEGRSVLLSDFSFGGGVSLLAIASCASRCQGKEAAMLSRALFYKSGVLAEYR